MNICTKKHRYCGNRTITTLHAPIKFFLKSFLGKFLILCLTWSFSFHVLSEIRHLAWDFGYGFELSTSKITGFIVIFGSFVLTILIYLIGKQII